MDVVAAVRAVFEEGWNQEQFETIEPLFSDTFALHIGETDRVTTVGELREIVRRWHVGFPDLRFEIHAAVSSGDRAAVHATLRGTHDGPWGDLDATGRSIEVEHMFFFRVEDDRLVEVWELLDKDTLRRQLTGG